MSMTTAPATGNPHGPAAPSAPTDADRPDVTPAEVADYIEDFDGLPTETEARDRERIRRFRARYNHPGHRKAVILIDLAELVADLADEILDDHPEECRCEFCDCRSTGQVRFDIGGLGWAARVAANCLEMHVTTETWEYDRYSDALRRLADEIAVIEDAEVSAPLIVAAS